MPPKPSETDLEMESSDEEMELETEPYPSDDELEEEEEKEVDDEGVVDAGEFKKGKKRRRVLGDTSQHEWVRYLMKELVNHPVNYFQAKEKAKLREEISASLSRQNILKTEEQIKSAIEYYFYRNKKLRFPLNDEDMKNEKVLRERAAARLLKSAIWYGPLLEVLSNDPGLLENLDIDAKDTIARRLRETHKLDKTGAQVGDGIRCIRILAQNGRVPPSLTTEKEQQDYERIAKKLTSTSKFVEWRRVLLKELCQHPDYLDCKDVVAGRRLSSVLKDTYHIEKSVTQIGKAISELRDFAANGRVPPSLTTEKEQQDYEKIAKKLTSTSRFVKLEWYHVLLEELCQHPDYLDCKDVVAGRRLSSVLKDTYHIEKTAGQIARAISRFREYAARGDGPSWMTKKEREDFMKIMKSRLTVKKTKSCSPKIRSRDQMRKMTGGRVEKKTNRRSKRRDASPMMNEDEGEEVETEAMNHSNEEMVSETESCAPKRGKRASTRNVIGDRIDKKKNKGDERRDFGPMFSDDEDEDVEKAVELRNENMLQELERAKEKEREMAEKLRENEEKLRENEEKLRENEEKLREAEEAIEKLRRIVKEEETSVAAEKEATVDGEAQFSVFSEDDKMGLPKEQQHLVTLEGMTIGAGKFLLTDLIGAGTFGVVFRAVEKKTGNVCALKIVQTQGNDTEIGTELKFMRRINNSGLMNKFLAPPSHSFSGTHNGVGFTAFQMELLHVDLFTVVNYAEYEKKRFPPVTVLSIMGQVFSALAFMNERGLVYCDVKPDNIMLKTFDLESSGDKELIINPEIRIIDLNAALEISDRPERCQSAHYRAPEVILRYDFSEKVDSWSMGMLGLELLQKISVMPVEYDGDDGVHEHIVRIEHLIDDQIPEKMWRQSRINVSDLPHYVPDDQVSMADILDDLEPSLASFGLQHYIPRLLKFDPNDRPTPAKAAEWLKDAFPHP